MKPWLIALVVLSCAAPPVAAIPTFDGEYDESWDAGRYSVIVAQVKAVEKAKDDSSWRATLLPMSTIAGKFDPGEHPELNVKSFGIGGSRNVPRVGDTVLTVVIISKAPGRGWVVPIVYMTFMPGGEGDPLVVIDGPADRRVLETLKRIQQARARGRAKAAAEKASTTKPAAATGPADRQPEE